MSWEKCHEEEIKKEYYQNLQSELDFIYSPKASFFGKTFPEKKFIFRCFEETPLEKVRIVILGQDPYHGEGQANGLAFAVNSEIKPPPSLKNIITESGCTDHTLLSWARQGVLLLNTTLTVMEGKPMSCAGIGWETYTDNALKYLLENTDNELIFCLWGRHAQAKKKLISSYDGITILEASHPSPLSAYKTEEAFMGCGHFKKINELIKGEKITW